jgi:hypothetical protein
MGRAAVISSGESTFGCAVEGMVCLVVVLMLDELCPAGLSSLQYMGARFGGVLGDKLFGNFP